MKTATPEMIDQQALPRIEAQHAQAAAAGFDFAQEAQLYPNGHVLFDGASATFQAKRDAISSQPRAVDGLEKLIEAVKWQQRRDHVVSLADVRLVDGQLVSEAGEFKLEREGWRKLAAQVFPSGGATYATECLAQGARNLAAFNFNFWAGHKSNADKRAQLRTRRDDAAGRKLWAVVSEKYGKCDIDRIAGAFAKFLETKGNGARCEWALEGDGGSIDINHANPIDATKARVGEVFHAGYRLETNDAGQGRAVLHATVTRVRCRNVSTITTDQECASVIHRGTEASLLESIMAGVRKADAKIATFADAWADAERATIFAGDDDARAKISKLCDRGLIAVPGVDRKQLFNAVWASFQQEPGRSRASLVNAVNLAAHTKPWPGASPFVQRELEKQAGQLVYARDLSVN